MKTLIKKLSLVLLSIIAIVVLAVVALIAFVNPNQFKPLIVEQVEAQTGLTMHIEGDIEWQFFPSFGLSLGKTLIDNPDGFSAEHLFSVNEVAVSVSVMPLLDDHLYIEEVVLDNAVFNYEMNKNKESNIDAVLAKLQTQPESVEADSTVAQEPASQESVSQEQATQEPTNWSIAVAGVAINDSRFRLLDNSSDMDSELTINKLQLSEFAFDEWAKLELSVQGRLNQQNFYAEGHSELKLDEAIASPQLRATHLEVGYDDANIKVSPLVVDLPQFGYDAWHPLTITMKAETTDKQAIAVDGQFSVHVASQDFALQLKELTVNASVDSEEVKLSKANLSIPFVELGKPMDIALALEGEVPDLTFSAELKTQLNVDEAVTAVKMADIDLNSQLKGATLPRESIDIAFQGALDAVLDPMNVSVRWSKLAIDELQFDGNVTADLAGKVPSITYLLRSPNVDVDKWIVAETKEVAPENDSSKSSSASSSSTVLSQTEAVEPDLSALSSLNVAGRTEFKKLKASNVEMSNFVSDIVLNNGILNIKQLKANMYEGSYALTANLNSTKKAPTYNAQYKINQIQVKPLMMAVAESDIIEGRVNVAGDVKGASLIPDNLMKNVQGKAKLKFTDGAINGINVAQIIRDSYAKIKGNSSSYQSETKQTDFSALEGDIQFKQGVVTTNNMSLQSPLLRVLTTGKANYIQQNVDMLAKASVVGTLEGQGGQGIDDLKDLTIPLTIKGSWQDPSFGVDFSALKELELERNKAKLEEKAKKEAERGLEKLLGDKVSNDEVKKVSDQLLNKLFN